MARLHIIGRKNSGKTTLIVDLVECLTARGYRVGTIKHTHHRHELDVPGKDSYRHRTAGARVVGIQSPTLAAVFLPVSPSSQSQPDAWPPVLESVFADCDLILVEGHSQTDGLKVEVWRAANGSAPYAAADSQVRALITDDRPPVDLPVWPRGEIEALADRMLHLLELQPKPES